MRIEVNVLAVLLFWGDFEMDFEDFDIAFCVLCG